MQSYKVCVYAICKNEEKFVSKWMDSMKEADTVVVTDTGSTDKTVERLKEYGATVHINELKPWRFDTARNISLSHVPEDADICVCTDLDETFTTGWRTQLESAWQQSEQDSSSPTAKKGEYLYNWSLNPDGSPDVQFVYSKIHSRQGFHWKWPVHEYICHDKVLPLKKIFIEGMVLNHYPDPSKPRSSYLPLLELGVKESPTDDRMMYYLGREYMYYNQWQSCIETLTVYLKMPTALWREERCAAMRWIAKSHFMLGQASEAYRWYYRAIAESPHMRDPYIEFAKMCNELGDWETTLYLTSTALKIKQKSVSYINMGYSWDQTPNDLHAAAVRNLKIKTFKD